MIERLQHPLSLKLAALCVAIAVLLLAAPAASANRTNAVDVSKSWTTMKIKPKALKKLKRAEIKCRVINPDGRKRRASCGGKTRLRLGITNAEVFYTDAGPEVRVKHDSAAHYSQFHLGTKRWSKRRSTISFSAPYFVVGEGDYASFRLPNKKRNGGVKFFDISVAKGTDFARWYCEPIKMHLKLSKKGSRYLKRRTGKKVKPGLVFATAETTLARSASDRLLPPCDPNAEPVALTGGTLSLRAAHSTMMDYAGIEWPPQPALPLHFAITGGTCTPGQGLEVKAEGTLGFYPDPWASPGTRSLELHDPAFKTGAGGSTISFEHNGSRITVFQADSYWNPPLSVPWGTYYCDASELTYSVPYPSALRLTEEGAALLSAGIGSVSFPPGEVLFNAADINATR